MATMNPGGPRGRRKQAKPQRKVELDMVNNENRDCNGETPASAAMSHHDTNRNATAISQGEAPPQQQKQRKRLRKEATVPKEEVLNGLSMHSPAKVIKTGGTAEDLPNDLISAKAAVGEQSEDEEKIKEYLQRSDTAVIYAEPVGRPENVSPLTNGVSKDGDDLNVGSEYFIKCPQCQKGCQTFQALKEHMEASHAELTTATTKMVSAASEQLSNSNSAVSPTPSLVGTGGPFACSQCTNSFATKDQLEKHELLHSPNAQVCCKICNKTFANVYRLQRHMISHDESAILRKFKCDECEKAFKFKHHLKEHIRIHSGEKPFVCSNCGKRFSHSGSYSSHMSTKKCLVLNLNKQSRVRPSSGDRPAPYQSRTSRRANISPINNNITTTSPNHNSYLPILPKYSEAAAAFLQSSLASTTSLSPFYLTPPSLLNATHPITPYSMPNLGHIFEQLQQQSPLRPPILDVNDVNSDEFKTQHTHTPPSPKTTSHDEPAIKSSSSDCGDLVMDEDQINGNCINKREESQNTNNDDLESVKRILETVNATVTKQLLQANMQKLSSESSSDCHSIVSIHSPKQQNHQSTNCKQAGDSSSICDEHECELEKNEGLAVKLEEVAAIKNEEMHNNGSVSGAEDVDSDRMPDKAEDDIDSESVTTTDHVSEDGRKVRVRSLISDEQLKVLKDNYKVNPRPKREDLEKIAESIGFPVRVVQVWFQNTRARDRREGRIIQVPYSPAPAMPLRYPIVPANSHKMMPSLSINDANQYISEQPLDLSTKRGPHSSESSPMSSPPHRPTSVNQHYDNNSGGDEVVNLSRKSSRSPTSYIHHQNHFHNSNSSETCQSPSPIDFQPSNSRLAQILAQPAHKLTIPGMGLMPMEQLMQLGAADLTQIISNRISSLSPSSKKRLWGGDNNGEYPDDDFHTSSSGKRCKLPQFVLKSLESPVLAASQEGEIEGQFNCDQCDKSFSKQSSLARHIYEHSGQRPHKCDECPKAFKHKHHLTEHKRLHSGEKPFQCIKCLKRFSHSGSYSQHMNHRYSFCKPYRE